MRKSKRYLTNAAVSLIAAAQVALVVASSIAAPADPNPPTSRKTALERIEPGHFRTGDTPGPGCLKPGRGPLKLRISTESSRIPKNSGGVGRDATLANDPNSWEFGYAQLQRRGHNYDGPHWDEAPVHEVRMTYSLLVSGESWHEWTRFGWQPERFVKLRGEAGWIAGIHAPIVQLEDRRWFAFGRAHDIEGRAPYSFSRDDGKTWTYRPSPFPPLHPGQRPVLKRLAEGPLMLVSYANRRSGKGVEITDAAGRSRCVDGMFAALSFDEGSTWPRRKLIPREAENPESADTGGYLSCVQTPDRTIHLLSSRRYYRFNLAWLREPQPALSPSSNRNTNSR